MTEQKMNFDDEFQLGIFELMCIDSNFCERACDQLKQEYFKNKYYAYFFEKISNLRDEFKQPPTKLQIQNELLAFDEEKRKPYQMLLERIFVPKFKRDHNYIRERLLSFVQKATAWQINNEIVKNASQDPERVWTNIQNFVDVYNNISFSNVECQTVEEMSKIMVESSQEGQMIKTYMPWIDKNLGGGVPRGTLTVALSGTNVGKSIFLMNWAYHLIKDGKKVLVVSLEGYKNQFMLRLGARALGCYYSDLRFDKLNDLKRSELADFQRECQGRLQHYHDSSFGFTIEKLVPIIRQKKEEFDFDVLMVDYGQILSSSKKFNDMRFEQAYVHRGLAALSGELNVAGITVAQGNRQTQEKNNSGKGIIRMNDISECFEIVRAAAQVFTLNRSDDDVEMDLARVYLDKQRDGRTGIMEICRTDFQRMAFYGSNEEGLGFLDHDQYFKEKSSEANESLKPVDKPMNNSLKPVGKESEPWKNEAQTIT